MGKMEAADFAIDCFPFAGSNTVSDNLHLRKPVVCLEGDRWFNRIGPAMLRSIGLEDTIGKDRFDFEVKLRLMIENDRWRNDVTDRLKNADLQSTVYRRQGAAEFAGWMADRIESVRK
jgi:predicted O-linked N-acetylglucosamine transferase (SPINDLY family)